MPWRSYIPGVRSSIGVYALLAYAMPTVYIHSRRTPCRGVYAFPTYAMPRCSCTPAYAMPWCLCIPDVRNANGVQAFLTYTMQMAFMQSRVYVKPWYSLRSKSSTCTAANGSSYTSRRHDRNCTCRRFHHSIRIRPVEPRPKNSCYVRPQNAYNRTKKARYLHIPNILRPHALIFHLYTFR